jgi:hypothetical protein
MDGSEYIGQFINDEAEGHGIFTDRQGNRYMTLLDGEKSKQGEKSFAKSGYFSQGKIF